MGVTISGAQDIIATFAAAPAALDTASQGAMQQSVLLVEANAKARTPRKTGRLQSSIGSVVSGGGNDLVGRVGTNVSYAPYQEYGTRDHGPVTAKYLRFVIDGRLIFAKRVRGVTAKRFMADGLAASEPGIEQLFRAAIEEALGE